MPRNVYTFAGLTTFGTSDHERLIERSHGH
jgi:hypothetical protein